MKLTNGRKTMEKLCIDVRGFSEEKKKRVQDAFFALGIEWAGDKGYANLHAGRYGNVYRDGERGKYLMFGNRDISEAQKPHEVTYTQLMQKAGLPIDDPDAPSEPIIGRNATITFLTENKSDNELDLHQTIKSYLSELERTQNNKAREILVAHIENLLYVEFYWLTGGDDE